MNLERREIDKDELIDSFWDTYKETAEYKSGRIYSINSTHRLVREAEERGLERVYTEFVNELDAAGKLKDALMNRSNYDWLDEWRHMYMDYDETRSEAYNASIRRYNDSVEALLNKMKLALQQAKEKDGQE